MNLSTDKAVDVLIEITPYIADILNDNDLRKIIDKNKNKQVTEKNEKAFQLKYFAELIPIFLKKHREAVYIILGSLNEKTAKEISEQPLADTIAQIKAVANDKDLIGFFQSFAKAE